MLVWLPEKTYLTGRHILHQFEDSILDRSSSFNFEDLSFHSLQFQSEDLNFRSLKFEVSIQFQVLSFRSFNFEVSTLKFQISHF